MLGVKLRESTGPEEPWHSLDGLVVITAGERETQQFTSGSASAR